MTFPAALLQDLHAHTDAHIDSGIIRRIDNGTLKTTINLSFSVCLRENVVPDARQF